jgi:hypothetical protein
MDRRLGACTASGLYAARVPGATHDWLSSLDGMEPEEQWALTCFIAGRDVEIEGDDLNASLRRAELLLASGGDPRRAPELYSRAVSAVAADLDTPDRRSELRAALERLAPEAEGLRGAGEALRLLLADADLAWQAFAYSLLAERLADDEE